MSTYMLLLYDNPAAFEGLAPEEMQGVIGKYMAWRKGLEDDGRLVGGEKLTDGEGRVLRPENGEVRVLDGPFSETKEVIGGYFAITAEGYDEAVAIARGCPHLAYEGTIEIRCIDEMH